MALSAKWYARLVFPITVFKFWNYFRRIEDATPLRTSLRWARYINAQVK